MRQIDYRKLAIGPEDVCEDIIDTALMIARESRKMNKGEDTVKMTELQDGIRGFQGFLMYGGFHLADAVVAAAKSAYLAAKKESHHDGQALSAGSGPMPCRFPKRQKKIHPEKSGWINHISLQTA